MNREDLETELHILGFHPTGATFGRHAVWQHANGSTIIVSGAHIITAEMAERVLDLARRLAGG